MSYVNERLNEYKKFLEGKSVSVIGVGISNIPLINFLLRNKVGKIVARDFKSFDQLSNSPNLNVQKLIENSVEFVTGENYLENLNEDIIFKSPGIRFDKPEILNAYKNGSIITSEMEAFLSLCPSKLIAITGSDGKTTTTTLVAKILEKAGKTVHLGGNIGKPLLDNIEDVEPEHFTVLELSSFQLHTINRFENKTLPFSHLTFPDVAIITNVTPNHLNWHIDMKEYAQSKSAIYKFMKKDAHLVANKMSEYVDEYETDARRMDIRFSTFSAEAKDADIKLVNDKIFFKDEQILDTSDIVIKGKHNVENYMAAIGAVYEFVTKEDVYNVASSFGGVEHRLELVADKNGIKYYNSSIDSTPSRTLAALSCFDDKYDGKIVLMLGGQDKNLDFSQLGDVISKRVKAVFISHDTQDKKVENSIRNSPFFDESKAYIKSGDGFDKTLESVLQYAKNGDVVLLSPAMTSFDEFSNFEERGRRFKEIVLASK